VSLKIESLTRSHDRVSFDCGDNELNQFLQRTTRQHTDKGLSKTFVLVDEDNSTQIIAYMTLVVCEVLADDIPHPWKKKYPRRIPAARLAKLAVSIEKQRKGYGKILLIDAMQKTLNSSNTMGIAGLFVDAKHKQAQAYYEQFGFIGLPEQLNNRFLPITTIAKSFNL